MGKAGRKSQVFTPDLIIGLSIAVIVFAASASAWGKVSARINEDYAYGDMLLKAIEISDILVRDSSGGIVSSAHVVDPDKAAEFASSDYDEIRDRFNVMPWGFYFEMRVNGSAVATAGNKEEGKQSASVVRAVLYNGEEAVIEFRINEE